MTQAQLCAPDQEPRVSPSHRLTSCGCCAHAALTVAMPVCGAGQTSTCTHQFTVARTAPEQSEPLWVSRKHTPEPRSHLLLRL